MVIRAALSRLVDDLYNCACGVVIGTLELTDPMKVVILAMERDLLTVMIQPRVPLMVAEQSEKVHRSIY